MKVCSLSNLPQRKAESKHETFFDTSRQPMAAVVYPKLESPIPSKKSAHGWRIVIVAGQWQVVFRAA
jgi:hypothetical protein